MSLKLQIGSLIHLARRESHLSQKELGKQMGVSARTIMRWENQEGAPSVSDIEFIAKVTNKPLTFFLEQDILEENNKDDETIRKDCISDLIQWAQKSEVKKIKAVIELLKE